MIFEYTDMNKSPAHCDIEKIGSIIIMTELADNTGASVTNSCEYIAHQYTEQHGLSVDGLTFIERYNNRSYESKDGKLPSYTLVTFTESNTAKGKLTPHWEPLTEERFNSLIEEAKL
jgi:hypothetical protein